MHDAHIFPLGLLMYKSSPVEAEEHIELLIFNSLESSLSSSQILSWITPNEIFFHGALVQAGGHG